MILLSYLILHSNRNVAISRGNPQISIYVGDLYCDITHHDISMRQYSNCWYDKQVCIPMAEGAEQKLLVAIFGFSIFQSFDETQFISKSDYLFFFLPKVNLRHDGLFATILIQRLIAQNYVTLNIDLKCIVVIQYQNLSKIVATGPIHVQKGTLTAFFAFLVTVKQGVSLFINKKYVTVGLFIQQEGHMHVHVLW